jgi:hypothetical protein
MICGGFVEWCYQCGAWRNLKQVSQNGYVAASKWQKPTGIGGPNPAAINIKIKD